MLTGRVSRQRGYPLHARNGPYRPVFTIIFSPHFPHTSSEFTAAFPSSFIGRVLLQAGNPLHARNRPFRPHLMIMGLPHFSQVSSVSSVNVLFNSDRWAFTDCSRSLKGS